MNEMQNFVLGFSLSFLSIALITHAYSDVSSTKANIPTHITKISLYKKTNNDNFTNSFSLSSSVKKESIKKSVDIFSHEKSKEFSLSDLELTSTSKDEHAYSDDDEILAINTDDIIPIDYNNNVSRENIEVSNKINTEQVAMLPTSPNDTDFEYDNPWITAQGNRLAKNKKILEKYADTSDNNILGNIIGKSSKEPISYKVAEKIKQSIIFPIPNEILSDENLVPTFISDKHTPRKSNLKQAPKEKHSNKLNLSDTNLDLSDTKFDLSEDNLKILPKANGKEDNSENILQKMSSWFKDDTNTSSPKEEVINKVSPSYSSQNSKSDTEAVSTSSDDLVSFYETLQETHEEQVEKNIIPTELRLYFQPNKAEISGQTLRWLKAFSEKAKNSNMYLQIRLDATAPVELQRKRLNLLYTILVSNDVDFSKIDTVFSLTEQNAFIIRTLKIN